MAKQPGGKTDLKEATGEFFGTSTVQSILSKEEYLGGSTGTGKTGLDGVYKVNNPNVDYVFIEYKYNTSKKGKTADGTQGSDTWVMGSERLEKAVGSIKIADQIRDAIKQGRTETWLVRTLPDGRTRIQLLDSTGNPKSVTQSSLLPRNPPSSGAQP